jgi:hypothetical protein
MDLVLVSIAAISLVLAIAMGLIVLKLQREERERSDARVALLAAAVGDDPVPHVQDSDTVTFAEPAGGQAVVSGDLFAVPEAESPWLRRLGVAAAVALIVTSVGYGLTELGSAARTQATTIQAAPLELVALQHTQDADTLTISGAVSNPPAGATVTHIAVAVQLFGSDGTLLATGRAPLDYATLAPGDESGFVIKVRAQDAVRRYRVGFRRPDGSIVGHVDRRRDGSAARNTGRTESAPWVR